MPIEFRCTGCQKLLRTPDESAGKKARCPHCGAFVDIPAVSQPSALTTDGAVQPSTSGPLANDFANPFADEQARASSRLGGSENPYAAPPAGASLYDLAPKFQAGELIHRRATLDEILNGTWALFRDQMGICILLGLILLGISFGVGVVNSILTQAAQATRDPALIIGSQIFGQVVSQFLQAWFEIGAVNFVLNMARRGRGSIGDFFAIGPWFMRGIGFYFLRVLIVLGVVLPCLIPGVALLIAREQEAGLVAMVVGTVVGLIIAMVFFLRYYLGLLFIVDRESGVMAAMQSSAQFMAGNKGTVFLTQLVLGVVGLFGIVLTCGIGCLFFYPFAMLVPTVVYLLVTSQSRGLVSGANQGTSKPPA